MRERSTARVCVWSRGGRGTGASARAMMEAVSVPVNLVFSVGAFLAARKVIGSSAMQDLFIKAGLFGKDMNKTSEKKV